jgi:hypothetical protein
MPPLCHNYPYTKNPGYNFLVPSDQLFKEFLREFLPAFLTMFFPEESALLNFEHLRFLDKEVFTDFPEGDTREADLIAEVQTQNGEPELLLIHIEVQAKRNPDFAFRMWQYYSLIRLRHKKPVFPLVIYLTLGSGGLVMEEYRETFANREWLLFRYAVVGLPDLPAEQWESRSGAVSASLATLMQSEKSKKARRVFDGIKRVVESPLNEAQKLLLAEIIERLGRGRLTKREEETFATLMATEQTQEIREMISIYEERGIQKGIEQGIERGIEQGIEQGVQQGTLRLTLRLLGHKFGEKAVASLEERIASLPTATLESLGEALLDIQSLDNVEQWLVDHASAFGDSATGSSS